MREKIEHCDLRRERPCNCEGGDYGNCRTCELATNWAGSEIKRYLGEGTGEEMVVTKENLDGGGFVLKKTRGGVEYRVSVNKGIRSKKERRVI